jgi:hypothetical protein
MGTGASVEKLHPPIEKLSMIPAPDIPGAEKDIGNRISMRSYSRRSSLTLT